MYTKSPNTEFTKCHLAHWSVQRVEEAGEGVEQPSAANLILKSCARLLQMTRVSEPTLLFYKSFGGTPLSGRSLAGELQICWNLVGASISSSIEM